MVSEGGESKPATSTRRETEPSTQNTFNVLQPARPAAHSPPSSNTVSRRMTTPMRSHSPPGPGLAPAGPTNHRCKGSDSPPHLDELLDGDGGRFAITDYGKSIQNNKNPGV